jgi:hypothetical protein
MENGICGQTSLNHDARTDADADSIQFFYGNALRNLVQTRTTIFLRTSQAEKMLCTQDPKELNWKGLFSFILLNERTDLSLTNFPDLLLEGFLFVIQFIEHGYLTYIYIAVFFSQ